MNCFLVLGIPRSGTSLVAGVLNALGVSMGDEWWPTDGGYSPPGQGCFQDKDFMTFSQSVFGWPWQPRPLHDQEETAVGEIVRQRCERGVDWGTKDHAIGFYLPTFVSLCHYSVKLILTRRAIGRSVDSWVARSGDERGKTESIFSDLRVAIDGHSSTLPSLSVDFDGMIDRPLDTVAKIAAFAGKPVNDEAIRLPDQQWRRF